MATYSKTENTRRSIIEAAKKNLLQEGFSGLSTRKVAAIAGIPMSQIQYHFGSKDGMVLALFENMNNQLLDRQSSFFSDPEITLSKKWEQACIYLNDDIDSGYVRVFLELTATGWGNAEIRKVVQEGILGWNKVLTKICKEAEKKYDCLGIFTAEEVSALINVAFFGSEAFLILGMEDLGIPIRKSLSRIGEAIRLVEEQA